MAFTAGGGVGIGEGTEVNAVPVAGGLAGGDGNGTGYTAKHHLNTFLVNHFGGVAGAFFRLAAGVADDQFQWLPQHTAGLVDFLNRKVGSQALLQALVFVASRFRVVKTDLERFGGNSGAAEQKQTCREQESPESHCRLASGLGFAQPILVLCQAEVIA